MQMPFDARESESDDALLAAYLAGDRRAAQVLTLRLVPRLLAFAARMLGDRAEAEDVAQEAMLRLWRMAPDWRPGRARLSTWLYRVTANLCTDRLRRRRQVALESVEEPADTAPAAETRLLWQQRVGALEAALLRLPDRQRQAVVLRHVEGLGNARIAEIMGVSIEAVESLTSRGKRALALALAGQREALGFEDDGT